jgi:hypothetical protein
MRTATTDSARGAEASRRPACSIIKQASNRPMPPPPALAAKRMKGASSETSSRHRAGSKPIGSAARTRGALDSVSKNRSNISSI